MEVINCLILKMNRYLREFQGTTLLVINNFTTETVERDYDQGKGKLLLANYPAGKLTELRPYESRAYLL